MVYIVLFIVLNQAWILEPIKWFWAQLVHIVTKLSWYFSQVYDVN